MALRAFAHPTSLLYSGVMVFSFDDACRGEIARCCAAFARVPASEATRGLKPVAVALRELDEEIGLRLDAGQVLGVLDDYPTRSGYLITPVVVWAGADARLQPNPHEVASVHRIALADITRPDAFDFAAIPESDRRVVRVRINGQLIHAPTAAVIYQFREVLAGRPTRV